MAAPQVNKRLLDELEVMGFPTVRSIRALHYSGNSNLESAVNWLLEHESDPDIDQLPLITREISIDCGDTSNEVRNDVQGMRAPVQERKPEERTESGSQKVKPVERVVVTSEQLRDCLRTLKKNHKDDSVRVTRAFQILLKIIANIVKNPAEEKFRRIRLSNPVFKDRVGNLKGGVEFLELCGFQRLRASGYLVMPRDKVEMALLSAAGVEIASAMENPYFGLLSK
ncbi:uncharacterized protein LOC133898980 isoform X1 [Phragmites australis]|uniref:uncharacterized protein LOC133898980 isoform X1 n=1 Tax=Phragmites australis TaxID=29695 RepID=UPI002D788B34|nr:uncharacterized protein LOC133898980 isoform X1 [Phragmites australis]